MISPAAPRILIKGGRVYDHHRDVHQPAQADILIAGETIAQLGQNLPADASTELIDAAGKLVVPGFVNAHYHSHDVLAKGLFEEMPFDIWALHSNPSNYGPRSLEEVRLRTLIGAAESLRNGITTIQDFLTVVPQDEVPPKRACYRACMQSIRWMIYGRSLLRTACRCNFRAPCCRRTSRRSFWHPERFHMWAKQSHWSSLTRVTLPRTRSH
jgi:cytosine/adenosine deaminase-related metal-dependent hydrolase